MLLIKIKQIFTVADALIWIRYNYSGLHTENNVCGSIGGKVRFTFLSIDKLRNRLFALGADQRVIKIIDLVTNNVMNCRGIPLIVETSYMIIREDGENAFVLEEKRNFLYRLDLISVALEERVAIGQHPNYLTCINGQGLLKILSKLSQFIIFVNPGNFEKTADLPIGGPLRVRLQQWTTFVAENQINSVSMLNLQFRLVQKRVSVGIAPRRLFCAFQKIYFTNFRKK